MNNTMKSNARKRWGWKAKVLAATGLTVALVGGGAAAAFAEGSFTSTMTQVQPTFHSRAWADNGNDSASTKIVLTKCKANAGGKRNGTLKIKTVGITLYKNGSSVGVISHKCGTYNFGNNGAGTYQFAIHGINANTKDNRKTFLNANVKVSY